MPTRSVIRVGIVVDHPKRDLPGAAMLARALIDRGIEVLLIPLYEQGIDCPLLDLDGIIVNFARPVNLDLVRSYHDQGVAVWVLDTEGGVLAEKGGNAPEAQAAYIANSDFRHLLTGYFFWGRRLHEAFVAGSGLPVARLHLTGCPRFDYTGPRWRHLLGYRDQGHILVNANFSLVNPRFSSSMEQEIRTLVANGWERPYIERLVADLRTTLVSFVDMVKHISAAFPEKLVVLRPHPFEDPSYYEDRLIDSNVRVDGSGSSLDMIVGAACVVHLNCGTAIEATMLDRLPLSVDYLAGPAIVRHSTLPARVSMAINSEAALMDALACAPAETSKFDFSRTHRQFVEPWFHLNDGNAADRVACIVADTLSAPSSRPRRVSLQRSMAASRPSPSFSQRAQAALATAIGSRAASRIRGFFQKRRTDKRFDVASVVRLMRPFEQESRTYRVTTARHPLSRMPLASVRVSRREGSA